MTNFLIAAASSNSGKTTITMGLLRALTNKGLKVQPYKCGPDYIDPMFHHLASGRESVNLDLYMSSEEHVKDLFQRYSEDADIRIVEGVMGMFDGYDKWHGSSAELAMALDIPVILVVNAKSVAYSVAPLVYGFKNFTTDPLRPTGTSPSMGRGLRAEVKYVIFNNVGSEKHFRFLKEACEDVGVECLGYVRRNPELVIPGRHLGLTISERENMEKLIELAATEVATNVNLEKLLAP